MDSSLDNGTVLPHGLLGHSEQAMMEGFNKSYKNFSLRVGVIVNVYPTSDDRNRTKLALEYDVVVIEQNEDKGATTILYRNCLAADALGAIADFFEKSLRTRKKKTSKGEATNTANQNGAVVLLLCLDGASDKGIIVGALTHPDRGTTLVDEGPRLEGEYNGVNIKIEKDGSCTMTFKGATDNDGNPVEPGQGNTVQSIEHDGSWQVMHDTITLRLDRTKGVATLHAKNDIDVISDQGNINVTATSGKVTVVAKGNVEVTSQEGNLEVSVLKGDANVTINEGNATITAKQTATVEGKLVKLGANATEAVIKGDTFAKIFDQHQHTGNLGIPTGPPLEPMEPSLSKKVKTE